jgi:hypothetical protein
MFWNEVTGAVIGMMVAGAAWWLTGRETWEGARKT